MKTYISAWTFSLLAAVALVKHRFMGADGNYCVADAKAVGVSEADTAADQMCPVIGGGIALVETAGAIAVGEEVVSDATGKALAATVFSVAIPADVTAVTSDAAQPALTLAGGLLPQALNGQALDAAGGAGEIIRVKLY